MTYFDRIDTPIGELMLASDGRALTGVWMDPPAVPDGWRRDRDALAEAAGQLNAYFAGELTTFDLPLAPRGTAFQLRVWGALRSIPYGETASYAEIARAIGEPTAFRAVGAANGRNPLPIVVPCHRVIGSGGSLVGFGGGIERKRYLLDLEAGALALL